MSVFLFRDSHIKMGKKKKKKDVDFFYLENDSIMLIDILAGSELTKPQGVHL